MNYKYIGKFVKLFVFLSIAFQNAEVLTSRTMTYSKIMATNDPDATILKIESTPKKVNSLMMCAIHANIKSCSAFKFENETCTLARTPPFIDKLIDKMKDKESLLNEDGGYYASLDKPLSREVHSDLLAYVLINEEEYFNAHKNLPNPPRESHYDGITKRFDFNKESPVRTSEGHLAGTLLNLANIFIDPDKSHEIPEVSFCLWYNSGSSLPSTTELLFLVKEIAPYPNDYFNLKIDSAGRMIYGFRLAASGNTSYIEILSNGSLLQADMWYYITTTYNIGTGEAKIYLNGTEILSQNGPSHSGFFAFDSLRIGFMKTGDVSVGLSGYIASFEMYDRVLSEMEVLDAMTKSTTYRVGMK